MPGQFPAFLLVDFFTMELFIAWLIIDSIFSNNQV